MCYKVWLKIIVSIILIALIAPILIVIPMSFTSVSFFQFPPPGYSLKWYSVFLENSEWVTGLIRSLFIAILTALLSTALGTMAALAVTKLNFYGKKLFLSLMIAPMIIPVIIVAIAIYYTFAPLNLTDSITGLVLSHTVIAVPIVFITVTSSLKGVDPNLELASMGLGSTPIGTFFKIVLPLIRPGIFSGALFALITSLDELVITIFMAGPSTKTLPIVMWENLRTQVNPTIAVVSTILIALTIILFLLQEWVGSRTSKIKNQF